MTTDDPLAPARGILIGLLIAVPLWALLILGGHALWTSFS